MLVAGDDGPLPSLLECTTNPDSSELRFRRALERDPYNSNALSGYARFLLHVRKDIFESEKLYQRAIDIDPIHLGALNGLAGIHLEEKINLTVAERFVLDALNADPDGSETLSLHAVWLKKAKKDYVGAEAGHRQALQSGTVTARQLCRFAVLLERTHGDNTSAAEELYKEAINMDPNDAKLAFHYGRLLFRRLGKVDEAEASFRRSLQLENSYTDAMFELAAMLHTLKHDIYQAESFYRAALKINPAHVASLQGYAALLDDGLKDSRGALNMCQRALAADPEHVPTLCRYIHGDICAFMPMYAARIVCFYVFFGAFVCVYIHAA
jgi:tetratricopeptide (TPR) repeat protein